MSVFERTREIGVMKVLGASLRDIRGMFIFESALIGLFGGLVGLTLSLGVSALMNATLGGMLGGGMGGEPTAISVIPPWLMLGAVAFSTAIGTLAGLAPAQRAVRLSPLDAIRSQ
jgi:ABC-type antimicrobial peptide transport system permease subunit